MISFNRDLLITDVETTGLDTRIHRIIQIACVLLDKHTLEEKWSFQEYIHATAKDYKYASPEALKKHNIPLTTLSKARKWPTIWSGLNKLLDREDFDISGFNIYRLDLPMISRMNEIYRQKNHWSNKMVIDLWPFFLVSGKLANQGYARTGYSSLESIVKCFGIKCKQHDALEDCLATAEALRRMRSILGAGNKI